MIIGPCAKGQPTSSRLTQDDGDEGAACGGMGSRRDDDRCSGDGGDAG
jgi:hypothetical protein